MVQVERLAVEVARRLADLEELLDLRVRDIEIAGGRATAQRPLRDGEREAVHHADERDDARGLAVESHRFADAADITPIGADAAAARGEPDILVPGVDDAVQAVGHRVQVAGDRQAAAGAAVRQNGRGGHEPQLRDIVVEPLRVRLVVGIGRGDADEQILIGFTRQQIAVVQRVLAEIGEERVAAVVHLDRIGQRTRALLGGGRILLRRCGARGVQKSGVGHARLAARKIHCSVVPVHIPFDSGMRPRD